MDEEAMKDILRRLLDSGEYMRQPIQWAMLKVLIGIHYELKAIREATETEAVEDAEPDPFQTLNGPTKPKGCGAKLAIEGWGGFCGETDMGHTLPTLCVNCGGPYQTLNGPNS